MKTPVTVLTGFLGAGKTTLLRHVLAEIDGARTVVVENEFGAANLDSEVLETIAPGMVRQINGCICCVVTGDLWHTFDALRAARDAGTIAFDRVIVETTGMAEPAGLIEVFYRGDAVQAHFRVDAVITVVDAVHAGVDLENSPTAQAQVALADVLVVNKTDQVDVAVVEALVARLRTANPLAEVHPCVLGRVAPGAVLGLRAFDAARLPAHPAHTHEAMGSVLVEDEGPHDLRRVRGWLRALVAERPYDFYRYKGVVHGARGQRVFVQGVHQLQTSETLGPWAGPRETRFVFIGIGLDDGALQAGLEATRSKRGRRPR